MSDVIKLLPDSVANQIAAGEVIQRPASVIKELVENAVDAGATNVQIILKDAGRTLIQVIDNGVGMTATDARLAFERHSTSKITQAQDLFSLRTMGFRGEALASIAAISHVELRTRARGAALGTKLVISASTCESQEPDVCPEGCNFKIMDLFFNFPARRKFLKSNQVELSHVIKEIERLALINHKLELSITHNNSMMYHLLPGSFKQRIIALWGHNLEDQLIPVATETSLVKIRGFISKPESARRRNALQFMFVNGRFMRHPYFNRAVTNCYDELIPEGCHPNYYLIFDVEPETIDVNIHPTKTEIKFENEVPIYQILIAAIKEALGRFNLVPSIDFDTEGAPPIPLSGEQQTGLPPAMGVDPNYNPFETQHHRHGGGSLTLPRNDYKQYVPQNWDTLYRNFENERKIDNAGDDDIFETDNKALTKQGEQQTIFGDATDFDFNDSLPCLQLNDSYIVTPVQDGLLLVDQHRAHVAILYNEYMSHLEGSALPAQNVLFPEVLHLSPAQNALMLEIEPQLSQLGFNLGSLSAGDWSINAIPGGLNNVNIKDLLLQVLDAVAQGGAMVSTDVYSRIAGAIARRAAIPRNKRMTDDEMKTLLSRLMRIENRRYTTDGHLILTVLTLDQIDKLF